ncbi:MAG: DNA starvation/stationary phase protection protein Dps [Polyangiales bacterium]|jgi:starvation-inducible DNA-binding protein
MKSYPTKNDLPEKTRKPMVELLNANLANAIDLMLQSKQAHWNVKGPDFIQLHELFDQVYAEATAWVDLIAERAVILGGVAEGSLQTVVKKSKLPPYGLEVTNGKEHVDALSQALSAFGSSIRAAIKTSEEHGDADTADLFTEVSRGSDKMLWFVEAHLQADR